MEGNEESFTRESDNEALSSLLMLANSNKPLNFEENQNSGNEKSDIDDNRISEKINQKDLNQLTSRALTLEDLRKYFHLPIAEVARQFGTCTTALKKICRKLNITKWPYRQILSLTKSIQSLEMASLNDGLNDSLKAQYREQIQILQKAIAEVMKNPNKAVDSLNFSTLTTITPLTPHIEEEIQDKSEPDVQHVIMAAAAIISQPEKQLQMSNKKSKIVTKRKFSDNFGDLSDSDKSPKDIDPVGFEQPYKLEDQNDLSCKVGSTIVNSTFSKDSNKTLFMTPIRLAPLERKKFRPSSNRKVVPLMEPDIGSDFSVEFVPNLIITMLYKSLNDRSVAELEHGLNSNGHSEMLISPSTRENVEE